jgi:hypothetical protein
VLPLTHKFEKHLYPPAPPAPPAAPFVPPPPPPATTRVLITLVPDCVVISPVDDIDVTRHFPKEDLFVFPIIPPFDEAEGLAI